MTDRPRQANRTGGTKVPHVLLAEDDDDARLLIATMLRCNGCEVMEVASGVELLEYLGASFLFREIAPQPDVIVADICMPGFTGTRVLAGLRQADIHTPFIAITASAGAAMLRELEALGADAVFLKPFSVDAFVDAVHELALDNEQREAPAQTQLTIDGEVAGESWQPDAPPDRGLKDDLAEPRADLEGRVPAISYSRPSWW